MSARKTQSASEPVNVPSRPLIDINGDTFDPSDIDTDEPSITLEVTPKDNTAYVGFPANKILQFRFLTAKRRFRFVR